MKLLLLIIVLVCTAVGCFGQARTAERIVNVPHSQLDTGNPPNGSIRHVVNGMPGTSPCAAGGTGAGAIKIDGVWHCPRVTAGVGTGDVLGPSVSSAGELTLYSDTSGKNIGRSNTLSGIPFLTNGVVTTLASSGVGNVVRATGATLTGPFLLTPTIGSFAEAQHTHEAAVGAGQLNASNVFSSGTIPPARVITGAVVNSRCLRTSNVGQIEVAAADCGSGGAGTPGGVDGNLQVNEVGSFGGAVNTAYNSATGTLTILQLADTNDTLVSRRATDTTPTGTFLRLRNAANTTDLFRVNANGTLELTSTVTSTNVAAPAVPAAGRTVLWTDTTGKNLQVQDDAGNVSVTIRAIACSGTDKVSSITSAGVVTCTPDQGGAGSGVITLNTLVTSDQDFVTVNDTNVTLTIGSAVSTHTFTVGWTGTLAKARQHAATVYTDQANDYSAGAQDFADAASLTVPTALGAAPTVSGQVAYDSTGFTLEYGDNGVNRIVANTTEAQTFSNKTLDNTVTANLRDTTFTLQDNADSSKTANFELSGITTGTNRVVTVANAASNTVIPTTATTNQWITHIDNTGTQVKAQPAFSNISGSIGATQGGTNQTAVAQGDLLYGDAVNSWARLAKSALATRYLSNTGASNNPAWAQVDLSNGVTGALPFASLSGSATDAQIPDTITLTNITQITTRAISDTTGDLAASRIDDGAVAATQALFSGAGAAAGFRAIADADVPNNITIDLATLATTATTANAGDSATAFFSSGQIEAARLGSGVPDGTKFLRDDGVFVTPAGGGDVTIIGVQTITGAKTFDPAKLIVGNVSAAPTPVLGAFYVDTDDGKPYFGIDGTQWGEIFVAGLSTLNLASGNVTGVLALANGGTNAASWTASRCVQVNAGGTALESAAAACGGGGTPGGADTHVQFNDGGVFGGEIGLIYNKTTDTLTAAGAFVVTATGAGYWEMAEGTVPAAVANRVTLAAPTDVQAGGWVLSLPTTPGTTGQFLQTNGAGISTWATPSGSGTVTATGGALTANAIVLGAGTTDTKVVTGIRTNGAARIILGNTGTLEGVLEFFNQTSGSILLTPPTTGALGAVTLTLPARTAGVATTVGTLTSGRCVEIDASGNFIQAAAACGSGGGGANTALSNLAAVAINTALISDTNNTDDLGSSSIRWKDIYGMSLDLGGTGAGYLELAEGTPPTLVANRFQIFAPADVAVGGLSFILPGAGATGFLKTTNSAGAMTLSIDTTSYAPLVSPSFTTPSLGVATATSINGLTITTTTGTLTVANGKTATVNNTLTFAGTDATTMTFPATTGTVMTEDSTAAPTNKSWDTEATGNTLTSTHKFDLDAAGCTNTTASSFWDLFTSTPAVAACVTGTVITKGVLDFADSGPFSAQTKLRLPSDFTGTVDADITWTTSTTTGNVEWSLATICTATGATELDDPAAFNTASTVVTAAPGVANRVQTSTITSLTITGCAANELMHVQITRDGTDAQDTLGATARLIGVQLTIRRAQ